MSIGITPDFFEMSSGLQFKKRCLLRLFAVLYIDEKCPRVYGEVWIELYGLGRLPDDICVIALYGDGVISRDHISRGNSGVVRVERLIVKHYISKESAGASITQ